MWNFFWWYAKLASFKRHKHEKRKHKHYKKTFMYKLVTFIQFAIYTQKHRQINIQVLPGFS